MRGGAKTELAADFTRAVNPRETGHALKQRARMAVKSGCKQLWRGGAYCGTANAPYVTAFLAPMCNCEGVEGTSRISWFGDREKCDRGHEREHVFGRF